MASAMLPHVADEDSMGDVDPENGRGLKQGVNRLADSNPLWPHDFAEEAVRLKRALGDAAIATEHSGGNSASGLRARGRRGSIVRGGYLAREAPRTRRRRRSTAPVRPKPAIIRPHAVGSGTDATVKRHGWPPASGPANRVKSI